MVSYDQVKLADSVECERGNDKEAAVRQQWPGIFFIMIKKYEYELMSEGSLKHDGDYSFVFLVETQSDSKIFFCENA